MNKNILTCKKCGTVKVVHSDSTAIDCDCNSTPSPEQAAGIEWRAFCDVVEHNSTGLSTHTKVKIKQAAQLAIQAHENAAREEERLKLTKYNLFKIEDGKIVQIQCENCAPSKDTGKGKGRKY